MSNSRSVVYQVRVLMNEVLAHLGIQIVRTQELDGLTAFLPIALAGKQRIPEVFVETGTYKGNTTARMARHFRDVHTIELSEELYRRASDRFENQSNVTCHHGSSPDVLRSLAPTIDEPAIFYLDAHWSGGVTAHGEVEVPLLEEIDIILARNMPDIIIVDDIRLVGTAGKTGLRFSREYPESDFDWRDITMEAILERLGNPELVLETADKLVVDLRVHKSD